MMPASSTEPNNGPRDAESSFRRLAISEPERLLSVLQECSLEPIRLRKAAEATSALDVDYAGRAIPVLLDLLTESSRYVRLGALSGLGELIAIYQHLGSRDVRDRLRILLDEPKLDAYVRIAAEDTLSECP